MNPKEVAMYRPIFIAFLVCLVFTATLHAAANDSITVNGTVDKPGEWTADKLKTELAADVTSISYTGHDGKHSSTAVPLVSLLKAAGVATQLGNPPKGTVGKDKHAELHFAVVVQGRDGYYTVLSISEIMAELGNKKIWLALDVDGKPWPEADAPMKLVIADDAKPARWVHSVQMISVVKVEPPATQPSK
jgi:DMSO/TMAO reductase YedYZ molybdopterin-dependent catalytic subunit